MVRDRGSMSGVEMEGKTTYIEMAHSKLLHAGKLLFFENANMQSVLF